MLLLSAAFLLDDAIKWFWLNELDVLMFLLWFWFKFELGDKAGAEKCCCLGDIKPPANDDDDVVWLWWCLLTGAVVCGFVFNLVFVFNWEDAAFALVCCKWSNCCFWCCCCIWYKSVVN